MEAGTEGTRRSQRRELQRGTAVKSTTKLANQSSRTRFGEEVGCLVGCRHVNEAEGAVIYGLLTKPVELAIQSPSTQAGPTPQWAPGPAHAPPGGPRRPSRACRVCPGVR